ncbi:class I adenylate-forming enzyme family protein [Elusimicrobiota bacterium]
MNDNLIQAFEQRAKTDPNLTAYIYREKRFTFGEVWKNCEAVACALQEHGVKKGDRFAICLRNSVEFITLWFALARLEAIVVHLNFLCGAEEIGYILGDSGAKGVITQQEFIGKIKKAAGSKPITIWRSDLDSEAESQISFSEMLGKHAGNAPKGHCDAKLDSPVALLYTSGTTGKPKGAILSHGNLASNALASIEHIGIRPKKEVLLCILPLFHIFAWTGLAIMGMFLAVPIVIVESITPPKPWLKLMFKHGVTLIAAVPPVYTVLAKEAKGIKGLVLKYLFFRKVRYAISGAAPLPVATLKNFEANFKIPLLEGYGLTETSPVISANQLSAKKTGTVGKILKDVHVKIVDEAGKELGLEEEGEICVKGPNITQGYWNLPEETKQAFTNDGYFITGDIGKIDNEGFLTICDRKKDMIIIKGLKVYPIQIEEIILRNNNVQEAAVVGIPGPDGEEIIKAFIVPKNGAEIKKQEIMEIVKSTLPPYKRPRDVEIRKELPKNALQKVLKRELREEAKKKLLKT